MDEVFTNLAAALHPSAMIGTIQDAEEQARTVLALLLDRVGPGLAVGTVVPEDPSTCPNCGLRFDAPRSPYCSDLCKEEAAFVRQFRMAVAEGSIFDKERQRGRGQALWHLLGGGYPGRQSLVPDKARARLFARNEGKCELCDAPATTFDHTGSG